MMCELLAPAGSVAAFRAAMIEGADAVYIGGGRFGARAYADNPDESELLHAIDEAHILGRRLYLTVNTLFKDRELERELYDWLLPYYREGLDGVIVQDLGVIDFLQKEFPELPLHASTQMTVTGAHGAEFLQKAGICRVVPARELSADEIRTIYDRTGMEIECFVHGAMCYSYSGQCLMSSLSGGRSGNRGRCAGICRLPFRVYENGRLLTGRNTQYPLNMKDMCTVELLPELLAAGVCSLKIEGRMKKPEYTAGVVRVYRKYLDMCLENPDDYLVSRKDLEFLRDLFSRDGFNSGYYHTWNGRDMIALRNEKLTGSRQKAAQAVTEQMRASLAAPESALALQREADGLLCLRRGQKASLTVSCVRASSGAADETADRAAADTAAVSGPETAPAQKRPVTEEEVCRQLQKTGGSTFRFRHLNIEMDPDVFIPMGQLNALRREAFAELEKVILDRFSRETRPETSPDTGAETDPGASPEYPAEQLTGQEHLNVRENPAGHSPAEGKTCWAEVASEDQFLQLLHADRLRGFYLPVPLMHLAEQAEERGFVVRLALPYILRKKDEARIRGAAEAWLDGSGSADSRPSGPERGILVRNLEELGLVSRMCAGNRIILDAGLYTMNSRAERFFAERGFVQNTVPHELNAAELHERDNRNSELIIYGRVPVMLSAQCLKKTMDRCARSYSQLELEDRKGMRFPVLCECDGCMNRILNSVPLNLLNEKDRKTAASLNISSFRFLFTTESGKEALGIVQSMQAPGMSTHGHFRRGVE